MTVQTSKETVCSILYTIEKNLNKGNIDALAEAAKQVKDKAGQEILSSFFKEERQQRIAFVSGVEVEFTQYLTAYPAGEVYKMVKQNAPHAQIMKEINFYFGNDKMTKHNYKPLSQADQRMIANISGA